MRTKARRVKHPGYSRLGGGALYNVKFGRSYESTRTPENQTAKEAIEVDSLELEKLAAQIGEEILARNRSEADPAGENARAAIAGIIDHTLLKADARREDIVKLCAEARQYGFAAVCVNPYWVPLAVAEIAGSPIKVCTVAGFPLGSHTTEIKRNEAEVALRAGAREIDMVINIGALKSGDLDTVRLDIRAVVDITHRAGAIVKVIIEAALLDDNEKTTACKLAKDAGADFVKTSTGFGPSGATAHDVALMRAVIGPDMGVKASGGIRTLEDFHQMVSAGASRVGASASVKIVEAAAR